MPLYITISEGPTAGLSEPIVATSDPDVVRVVGQVLADRLGVKLPQAPGFHARRTSAVRQLADTD